MGSSAFADRETVLDCLDAIETAYDQLQDCSFDGFSSEELVEVLGRREVLARRAPAVDHRILARLAADGNPGALGASSLSMALAERLRISPTVARRRLGEAADLGPRVTTTGQPLPPVLPSLAAAQAAGSVGAEHVEIARKAYAKIPEVVAEPDRARAEAGLAQLANDYGPQTFRKLADHLVAVLDPDGDFTDRERMAHRGIRLGHQNPDGMSALNGRITPELRATLEPLLAKLAAPGMCNPADERPCVKGTPTEEQIRSDNRTIPQRQHDALLATCRIALSTEDLGKLNGLPVTVIVTTSLAELQAAAGCAPPDSATDQAPAGKALTAGGSLLPMSDLLRMASHAYHYLTIFDGRGRTLWLECTKRIASADQRIALHARDHGCTRPGCTGSGYLAQAHHLERDWAEGGETNIDTLALVCAPDNRMASEQKWTTRLGEHGRVEWIPPPELERGQPRVNPYHFIEELVDYHRRHIEPPEEPDVGFEPDGPPEGWPEDVRLDGAWPDDGWADDTWPEDPHLDGAWPTDGPPDQPLPFRWLDDPLPGDPEYDRALDSMRSVPTAG